MAELADFQRKQLAFAAHIRDPKHVPVPEGIEDRRMAIYRQLFFNNLKNLLGNMFPILKKLHEPARWNRMIRLFMQRHRAQTPYFLQLPAEFLDFLQHEYPQSSDDFPFLVELAHYEYIELALSISTESNDLEGVNPDGDLLEAVPVKSRLAWVYAYTFPVHRISTDFLPSKPETEAVHLVVYRRANDDVGFLELNPVTATLLTALDDNSVSVAGAELLRSLAEKVGYPDTDAFVRHGRNALEEMRSLEIIIGTRPLPHQGDQQ